jgi:hypothetical protein
MVGRRVEGSLTKRVKEVGEVKKIYSMETVSNH